MSIGFSGMITQAQELSKKLPSVVEFAKEAGNLAGTFIETLLTKNKNIVEVRFNNSGTESERSIFISCNRIYNYEHYGTLGLYCPADSNSKAEKSKSGIRTA